MRVLHLGGGEGGTLRVLCLGAHSDDIEIGCGGTLLSMISENPAMEVHWVVFSAEGARAEEAQNGAEAVLKGAARSVVEVLDHRDGFFPFRGTEIKEWFEALKTRFDPDLILTHWDGDRHQDHRLLSELTWNTFRNHLILEYEVPKYDGDLGNPNVFVPLSEEVRDRKIQLLMDTFSTQREKSWFSPETFLALMRLRGIECASPSGFAEGFHARKLTLSPGPVSRGAEGP
ncbi:MAG: PIG-L family deacetylase [Gemmatimonadetes bacterium]|nr:PIG-L family deacetylase [Gemmatimonadota bacterium]NNM03680.1 PIG-L family deacetylase [Gemmatimonadota bacterium]